jgi:hypothetical protein
VVTNISGNILPPPSRWQHMFPQNDGSHCPDNIVINPGHEINLNCCENPQAVFYISVPHITKNSVSNILQDCMLTVFSGRKKNYPLFFKA